ncbi:hypothetical protein QTP88_023792 [Uroleucon formosanum]
MYPSIQDSQSLSENSFVSSLNSADEESMIESDNDYNNERMNDEVKPVKKQSTRSKNKKQNISYLDNIESMLKNEKFEIDIINTITIKQVGFYVRLSQVCFYVPSDFIMSENTEQRVCIKFCHKPGKTATETYQMLLLAYGDETMSRARVFEWFKRFKEGRTTVESDERPSTSRNEEMIQKIRTAIRGNRRLTIMELSNEFQISFGSVQTILTTDLDMRRVAAKFVPKLLSGEQKENRKQIATDLLECSESDDFFLKSIITGDETWVYGYDPETKIDVLRRLRDAVRRKRPEFKESGSWKLRHDNAPAHSAHVVQQFLAKHGIPVVSQPPYSPDLAPCDFFLFPKIKMALKGKCFQDVDEIKQNATEQLRGVSKNDFHRCFQKWQERWRTCMDSEGAYFEGD